MFSNVTRAALRARIEANLIQTGVIRRKEYLLDNYGARTALPATEYRVACYLTRVNRANQSLIAAADTGRAYYMLQLAYDADIADNDEVAVDGATYQVVQVLRRHGNDVLRQALVVKAGA